MQNREEPSTRRRDELVENARTVVDVAFALSPAIPIPLVSSIVASAKVICDTAASVRHDKRMSAEIAEYAADLATRIKETAKLSGREDELDDEMKLALRDTQSVLERVEATLKQQAALGLWARLKNRARVSHTISSTKEEMEGALRKFSVLSQVRLEMKVQQMSSTLQVSSKRHADGYQRFFVGDVQFEESFPLSEDVYFAKRKGELKVVKQISHPLLFEHNLKSLKTLRYEATKEAYQYSP
ncbi:hypothetical protein SCHPADRAFT_131230 [Schizopora paradoxa]|uniref:Fungal N-terminal domain-containing protein n=1 Tax=Schizopora paradoxa TaxID=27342 RepID=A0A0H2SM22_9AGAM|nr:hypothetical protein SCHPADRAFT_131230 [Schizopora paradoxa]